MSHQTPETSLSTYAAEREIGVTIDVAAGFDIASVAGGTRGWTESGRAVGVGL